MSQLNVNTIGARTGTTVSLASGHTAVGFGGGKVLQYVIATNSSVQATTSTSFADITNLTADITPSATTSKVHIIGINGIGMSALAIYLKKNKINPTDPFRTAHNITELFILCGKNQVNSLLAASGNNTLAISTIGMKVTQAIVAPITNTDQNTIFPCCDCLGRAGGTGFTIEEKNLICSKCLVSGMINKKPTIILMRVKSSFHCQI